MSQTLTDLGHKISELSHQVASKVKTVVETSKQAIAEKVEQSSEDQGEQAA